MYGIFLFKLNCCKPLLLSLGKFFLASNSSHRPPEVEEEQRQGRREGGNAGALEVSMWHSFSGWWHLGSLCCLPCSSSRSSCHRCLISSYFDKSFVKLLKKSVIEPFIFVVSYQCNPVLCRRIIAWILDLESSLRSEVRGAGRAMRYSVAQLSRGFSLLCASRFCTDCPKIVTFHEHLGHFGV